MIQQNDSGQTAPTILAKIFDTSRYTSPTRKYRAQAIYAVTLLILLTMSLYALSVPDWEVEVDGVEENLTLLEVATEAPFSTPGLLFFSLYIISFATVILTRYGMQDYGRWGPLLQWYIVGVVFMAFFSQSPGNPSGAAIILMVMGAFMIGNRGIFIAFVASLGTLIARATTNEIYLDNPHGPTIGTMGLQLVGGAILVYLFLRYTRVFREEGASAVMEERTLATDVVSRIAYLVAKRSSLDELLAEIVNRINDQFETVYHTQVFLVDDEGVDAKLYASTGEAGRRLLERGHSLRVGSRSVIGQVTLNGKAVIARAGVQDAVHRRNELLGETAVEAAFPLRVGDTILGALDLQSTDATAFDDPNLRSTLQALADSISLAIDNISQYESAEERLKENEALVAEAQQALRQVSRLNERLTGRAWTEYLAEHEQGIGLSVDFTDDEVLPSDQLTTTLKDAMQINQVVQEQTGDDRQIIAIPLRVAGRVIGAMEFELDPGQNFSPQDLDLVNEVSERFGLAVENARLVDESQRTAQREALVNQISSRLQSTNNVEAMLNEAARSVQDALKANRVAIRLGSISTTSSNVTQNGG